MDPLFSAPLPSPDEMSTWDRAAIEEGTASLELMERAGRGIAERIKALRSREGLPGGVLILCGPGNNGGDGLVLARVLGDLEIPCRVVVAGALRYSDDFLVNVGRLVEAGEGVSVYEPTAASARWNGAPIVSAELEQIVATSEIVVDALLGTGQREAPSGVIGTLVEMVQRVSQSCWVVAIDIPTGVDAESGSVYALSVKADVTIAIQFMKRGLSQYPARERCGEIQVIDIGIKPTTEARFGLLGEDLAVLPRRSSAAHKGDFGRVTVVGGSASMPGAPALAATAALRMGAGWVSLARPLPGESIPELMVVPVETEVGIFRECDASVILEAIQRSSAVVIGPGLGTDAGVAPFLKTIFSDPRSLGPLLVIDADALNVIAAHTDIGREFSSRRVVLTPHPGEAGRLLACASKSVQADRFQAAAELSGRYKATVVLKGAGTVVYGGGRGYVCSFGTPFLAAPGSGDVLAGVIGALGAQGFSPIEAACRGVVIHARAGEAAHRQRGGFLLASDITAAFGSVVGFR